MTPLPALVLTAGQGTRLDPLTRLVAKAAVPLAGRTLVEHVLEWIRNQKVTDVVLNLHHLPATITSVVGDGKHLGLSVRYSWEQPLLGSAGGPRRALPLIAADEFLIVNGDTLSDFELEPMIDAHRQTDAEVTMAVVPNPNPDHYNGLVVDQRDGAGVVTGFAPRGQAAGTWHFIGVQVVRSSAFAALPDGTPSETVAGFYRDVIRDSPGRIRAWKAKTTFLDVGTPRDYATAALGHPGSLPRRVTVWPEARVSERADLEDCIVAGPIHVPDDFHARSAVLVPAAIARPGDRAVIRDGIAVFDLT